MLWICMFGVACLYVGTCWVTLSKAAKDKPVDKTGPFVVVVEAFYPEGWLRLRTAPVPLSVAQSLAGRLAEAVSCKVTARIVVADRATLDAFPELPETMSVAKNLLCKPVEPVWDYDKTSRNLADARN